MDEDRRRAQSAENEGEPGLARGDCENSDGEPPRAQRRELGDAQDRGVIASRSGIIVTGATMGMMFMVGAMDLVTLYIGLETMAIATYVLVGFLRSSTRSNEAALKYFLLGAFSSGILLYGFSLLYGMAGSTRFEAIRAMLEQRPLTDPLSMMALGTVAAGMFFKIAAVPFHQWTPDAYEGAPTSITAYMSVAVKAASFAMMVRLFMLALFPLRPHWVVIMASFRH